MKKLFLKMGVYLVLILLSLEIIVRVMHLTKDYPERLVDKYGVEKWGPNQEGFSVTGNRRQNFSRYHINNSGYNSYREFTPSYVKIELALVGDSFIQGFHQDYYNSIGKKIENELTNIEVYEYGYAGYDFANQLHLISNYKDTFDKIDIVVLGLKFENDLIRREYHVDYGRMKLEAGWYKKARCSKLLVYVQNNGMTKPLWELGGKVMSFLASSQKAKPITNKQELNSALKSKDLIYKQNFDSLITKYGYDKSRYVLLLDKSITPEFFLDYLDSNQFKYIDFSAVMKSSKKATTLIYDRHWNNHGRELVAKIIIDFYKNEF